MLDKGEICGCASGLVQSCRHRDVNREEKLRLTLSCREGDYRSQRESWKRPAQISVLEDGHFVATGPERPQRDNSKAQREMFHHRRTDGLAGRRGLESGVTEVKIGCGMHTGRY